MELECQSDLRRVLIEPELELSSGGEARIYTIRDEPELVAKVYHEHRSEYERKLQAMLDNPPSDPTAAQGHSSIAWPIDLLREPGGGPVIGFTMPFAVDTRPVIDYYNPLTRRQYSPLFNYLYLYRTARNMSAVMHALHARNYVIGDVNESNILVTDTAMVTLVDTDSFQVPDPENHSVFHCPVAKAEFTPAELQGKLLTYVERAPQHDRFGLAVLVFQLLMEGTHPYSGAYTGSGDPPPYEARISAGHFPYGTRDVPYRPLPMAPPIDILPGNIWKLFVQCFQDGTTDPDARPDAETWVVALREAEHNLVTCEDNEQHRYGKHLLECPWCKRTAMLGGRDPFPARQSVQSKTHLRPGIEIQTPLPSAAPPAPLSMLGSLAVSPSFSVPARVVPNRQAAGVQTPNVSTGTPSTVPPAPAPLKVNVTTRPDVTNTRTGSRSRVVVAGLVVAAVIGIGAFAMRSRSSNHNVPTPLTGIAAPDTFGAPPPTPPAEAPAETLKQFNTAVVKGDEGTIRSLLAQYPGLVNQCKAENGDTPLHFAAQYNKAGIAQLLIDDGANVNVVDSDGYTPLHLAAQQGSADVGTILIQKGANINAVDRVGWTPLHFAAQEGKTSVAKLLLDSGADFTIKDRQGRTPLAVAKKEDKTSIADLLKAAGATQ